MEISPKFDNSYSGLCQTLYSYGYQIYDIGLSHQSKIKSKHKPSPKY